MEGMQAFALVAPIQAQVDPRELWLDLEFGDYRVDDEVADGKYEFVITVRDPKRVRMTKGTGHSSISGGELVYYAGTAYFKIGDLVRWNNDTGHYRTDVEHNHQAQITVHPDRDLPYLPLAKFVEYKGT